MEALCAAGLDTAGMRCGPTSGQNHVLLETTDPPRDDAAQGKTIAGRILGEDGLGIEGVTVLAVPIQLSGDREAADGKAPVRLTAVTAPGGYYAFDGLAEGDYRIQTANHGEYRSTWMSVRAGLMKADLVLMPERMVMVRGQVVGEDGLPLEGVTVLPNMVGIASASTDDDGRYKLKVALKPATTRINVSFRAPGFLARTLSVPTVVADDSDGPVTNVTLQAVEGWTAVSGAVTGADGVGLAGRTVQLQALGHRESYLVSTDENGEYLFPAVEAGLDYQMRVAGGPGFPDYTRHVRVDIDESEFDVVLQPFEYGEISGRLLNLDGAPVPDFELALRNSASTSPNAVVTSDNHGNFTIERAPAGEIFFATRASPSMIVRGVRLEAGDELDVPVILDWGEHEIRGLVQDRNGYPIAGSDVVLTWTHERDGVRSSSIRRTRSDAQGNFVFDALGPGPHRLEIDAPGRPALAVNYDASRQGYDLTVRMN